MKNIDSDEITILPAQSLASVLGGAMPAWVTRALGALGLDGAVNVPVTTGQDNKVQSGGKNNSIK